ncbi:type II toxin-antitoxin system VapB family antitoxin [Ferrimicrobium sp.]|uniref:type II toxin-antitoxin system VapB family antitoxin n=1 Tax=Ferrimicrobium sp. TaxID=2926050 RepID=UPI002604A9C3|nr:type II toxin-antitoxin system VapB family antitoxin [Ferrimicrobium sp.]
MRTTLVLDDDLVTDTQRLTGIPDTSTLAHEALRALVERESARRLASPGESEPNFARAPLRCPLG